MLVLPAKEPTAVPSRPLRPHRLGQYRPPLTIEQILAWADQHHCRTGQWPTSEDREMADAPAEKWCNITQSLQVGTRGLPGGSSLARLLAEHRGVRNRAALPLLTEAEILAWADAYRARTGTWPRTESGSVPEAPGEVWANIDQALRDGGRGQPGGSSLPQLLAARRGARVYLHEPKLNVEQILAWAQAHRERTGRWPVAGSARSTSTSMPSWRTRSATASSVSPPVSRQDTASPRSRSVTSWGASTSA
ncbi:MAG: hypothetical protein HYS12_20035 [Planctomycetes bacterium]|nr:hypothetical protein [Planctomycetota bacterium]